MTWAVLLVLACSLAVDAASLATCPLQGTEPSRSSVPFDTCTEFSKRSCCSYGETEAIGGWLREEKQVKYNVSVPFRVQSTIDVSSPRVLVRECGRILEQVGCAKSCSPDSARFVETSGLFPNSFWICPEYCEEFFQYCVDVTEQRFVNAQTFCEQQRLDNGLQVRVRDFSCYSAGRLSAAADQSFAYGRALYGGAANQLATFYVQAVDRFGNYKSRGGDEFIPSLFDSRGTPTPIKIVDNDDGTYTVTFSPKPDTYTIDVTLGGVSIRNVPRKATFSGSAKCILPPVAGLLPKPQPDLATCVEFSGNACCDNFILRPWGEAFESVYVNYAGTPVCKSAIDHLLCGIPCSPTQSRELRLNDGRKCPLMNDDDDDGGIGGNRPPYRITDEDDDDAELAPDVCESPVLAILTVCRDYCRRLYEACSDCKAADRGVTVASAFDTQEAFCRSLAPKGYLIEVGDEPNCFGTSQDASLSGSFAQLESVSRARVGTEVVAIVQAADDNGNYVLEGGSQFTVRLDGVDDDPRTTLTDDGNGRYSVRFFPTVAGTYDLHVFLAGQELSQSPFSIVIWPGEVDPAKSSLSGPAVGVPVRAGARTSFNVGARDSFGNDMLVGDFGFTARVITGPDETLTFAKTDLHNATTRFTFTPPSEGVYVIAIEQAGKPTGLILPVTVRAGGASSVFDATRTFASGAGLSRAEVGTPAMFVIKAGDSDGVQLATGGEKFDVRITGRDAVTRELIDVRVPVIDNEDGTYTAVYVLLAAPGPYVVDISHVGTGARIRPTPSVLTLEVAENELDRQGQFSPAKSSADLSTITSPTVGERETFKITSRNAAGNLLTSGGVQWRVALNGPLAVDAAQRHTTFARVTDNLDGTYTAAFTPIEAGEFSIDIRPAGVSTTDPALAVPLSSSTITVVANANGGGMFDIAYSTVTGAGSARAVEGRNAQFTIVAKDKYAVQMASGGLVFSGVVAAKDGSSTAVIRFEDNNDGTYTGTYQLAVGASQLPAGWAIQVQLDGQDVLTGDVRVLEAGTGAVSVAQSQALGTALRTIVAGRTQSVIVLVNDANGAPFVAGGVNVAAEVQTAGEMPVLAKGTDRGDGSYELRFRVETPGVYQLRITVDGQHVPGSPFTVNAAAGSTRQPTPFLMRAELDVQMATMSEMERMVHTERTYGRTVPELATLVDEEARFVVRSLADDGAEMEPLADDELVVEMRSAAHRYVAQVVPVGDGSFSVSFTPRAPGRYEAFATFNGVAVPTPMVVVVRRFAGEGEFDAAATFAFDHVERVAVGELCSVGVVAVDRAGLPMARGGERFVARVVPRVERADAPLGRPFSVPLRDNGDGTYTMQFAPHVAVAHVVTIEHEATRRVMARTPFAVAVSSGNAASADALAGVFSPAKSTVEGDGLVSAVAGRTARFVVRTRDANRHPLQSGGLHFKVRVAGPVTVEPRVTDNGDGTYSVEYQTPRAGQYVVSVRTPDAAHQAIGQQDSYSVAVLDWLAPAEATLIGAERPLVAGSVATLTLVTRDAHQNPIISGGLWLSARVSDAAGTVSVAHVTDHGDGTYALRFVVPSTAVDSAELEVSVAGAPLRHEPFVVAVAAAGADATPVAAAYEYTTLTERFGTEALDAVLVQEGVALSVALHLHDAAKQPLAIGGDELRAFIVAKDLPGTTVPRLVAVPIVDNGDGSFLVDVVVSNFIASSVHWSLRVERVANGAVVIERAVVRRADAPLFRAPPSAGAAAVSADVDSVQAAASYAFGPLVRAPTAVGASVTLGVQLMADASTAAAASGELLKHVAVVLRGSPASGVVGLTLPLAVAADSQTLVVAAEQSLSVAVGVYLAHVTIDGVEVRASPYAVRVVPPHFARDSLFSPLATLVEAMEDAQGAKFNVQTRDGAGRKLPYGGLRLGAVLRSPTGVEHRADVHDNSDGSYTLIARASETGAHELTVHSFDGSMIVRRQVTVTANAANDCPQFWQTLGVGALYAEPNEQGQFFIKPCDCDGKTISSTGIDVTDSASVSAIKVTLLGPSGKPLDSSSLFEVKAPSDRVTQAPFGVEDAGDGSFIVSYRGDVCGASQLSVHIYGKDAAASPHRLQFTDGGASQCSCPGRVQLPVGAGAGEALCSAHGVCQASTNKCVCEVGWSGADCATQPPPSVVRATFSSIGDRISVVFADQVMFVGANATQVLDGARFACSEALTDVSALGREPVCYFADSKKTLVALLGSGATIVPGGAVSVRGDAVANAAGVKPSEGFLQAAVAAPAVAAVPVVLVEAPSVIDKCTTADFVAQASAIGLAGREAEYRWSAPPTFLNGPSTVSALVERERGATLTIPLQRLITELQKTPGAAQTFQVCAKSFLGTEDCATFDVTLQIAARSSADIAGPNELRVSAGTPVTLKSVVTLRDGECQPAGANVRGVYLWKQTQGPQLPNDGSVSLVGTEITLPANVLEASTTYRFDLSVTPQIVNSRGQRQTLDQQAAATDYVLVVVGNGASLAARIVPAGVRTHPRSAPIKLDGSQSVLDAKTPVTYSWDCYARGDVTRTCWTRGSAPANAAQLELPSNALLPDSYTFVLTVRQGEATSSAETHITVVAEEVPVTTLRALGGAVDDVVNRQEPLTLVGQVTSVRGRETKSTWKWSPPLERDTDVAVRGSTVFVPPGSLTPGVEYTFTLRGDDGGESTSSRTVRVNDGPRNGNCTLVSDLPVVGGVVQGVELNTTFAIDCASQPFDDVAEDLPLTYYATYVRNSGLETSLLAAPLTTPVIRDIELPDGEIELYAYVIDAQGAATRVRVARIVVDNSGGDQAQLLEARHKALETALEAQDWDRSVQITNVLLLDDTTDAGCIDVAQRVRDDFRPAPSAYVSRTVATWVERQSATCNATADLRDAHLAILNRVAESGTTASYTPLGSRGESVANRVAAGAAAVIGRSNDIGGNLVAGQKATVSGSTPASTASVVALTQSIGTAQCDQLVAGAPASVVGVPGSAFSMRVERFQTPLLASELTHSGAKVLLPSRADALVLAAGAREVCTLHAVYSPSPFGVAANISSPVSFLQLVRADVASTQPPLDLTPAQPPQEARKRQEAAATSSASSSASDRVIDLGTLTVPVTVTLKQDTRATSSNLPLRCVSFRNNLWVDQGCRAGVKNITANGDFVCVCDQAGVAVATQLPPPVNLPPGAGVEGARRLPMLNGDFDVDWLAVALLLIVGIMLLCCFIGLWYVKRSNLRYEYLEKQRQKELEEAGAAVDYAQYKSEMSGEDASLVLRKAEIEISESVTSTSASSRSSSELGGRGDVSSKSSSSQSELGRTTESASGSELGQARAAGAKDASSSGTSSSRGGAAGGKKSSQSKSTSVSETTSSSLSKSGSDSEVLGEASRS